MKYKDHSIRLDFPGLPKGEIPFNMSQEIEKMLLSLSEGALRLFVEGNSSLHRGRDPQWVKRSLDFRWTGISKGSTVLHFKAPVLGEAIGDYQLPLFTDLGVSDLQNDTAFGLTVNAFQAATAAETVDTDLLDKNLLKKMQDVRKLFPKTGGLMQLIKSEGEPQTDLTPETFEAIQVVERKTPESQRFRFVGVLDEMKHSRRLLGVVTEKEKKLKATLGDKLSFEEVKPFFGKKIQIDGIANFNPGGRMTGIVIQHVASPADESGFFAGTPIFIQEGLDLPTLMREQNYKGANADKIHQLVNELDIEDDLEDLLRDLKSSRTLL